MDTGTSALYPSAGLDQDRWILNARSARNPLDPRRAYAALVEDEPAASGELVSVATLFLTNRECPWRCLMCDLWKNTLTESVPEGAIARQIRAALAGLPRARHVKLYNAGSFFDPRAIAPSEDAEIAALVRSFERVIVESHPALVKERCREFHSRIGGRLEVAMGLETVHPEVLPRLNKRMTVQDFDDAAGFLARHGIGLRVFVLAGLPFLDESEGLEATRHSIVHAFDAGAGAVSIIPTRAGNGALEALAAAGEFVQPRLRVLEDAVDFGLSLGRGRIFADLWDLGRFERCASCFEQREARLADGNRRQRALPRVPCSACGGAS